MLRYVLHFYGVLACKPCQFTTCHRINGKKSVASLISSRAVQTRNQNPPHKKKKRVASNEKNQACRTQEFKRILFKCIKHFQRETGQAILLVLTTIAWVERRKGKSKLLNYFQRKRRLKASCSRFWEKQTKSGQVLCDLTPREETRLIDTVVAKNIHKSGTKILLTTKQFGLWFSFCGFFIFSCYKTQYISCPPKKLPQEKINFTIVVLFPIFWWPNPKKKSIKTYILSETLCTTYTKTSVAILAWLLSTWSKKKVQISDIFYQEKEKSLKFIDTEIAKKGGNGGFFSFFLQRRTTKDTWMHIEFKTSFYITDFF